MVTPLRYFITLLSIWSWGSLGSALNSSHGKTQNWSYTRMVLVRNLTNPILDLELNYLFLDCDSSFLTKEGLITRIVLVLDLSIPWYQDDYYLCKEVMVHMNGFIRSKSKLYTKVLPITHISQCWNTSWGMNRLRHFILRENILLQLST